MSEEATPTGQIKNNEETPEEQQLIAEMIFDWWISGKSYARWYADKFLQGKLFGPEDFE